MSLWELYFSNVLLTRLRNLGLGHQVGKSFQGEGDLVFFFFGDGLLLSFFYV